MDPNSELLRFQVNCMSQQDRPSTLGQSLRFAVGTPQREKCQIKVKK